MGIMWPRDEYEKAFISEPLEAKESHILTFLSTKTAVQAKVETLVLCDCSFDSFISENDAKIGPSQTAVIKGIKWKLLRTLNSSSTCDTKLNLSFSN